METIHFTHSTDRACEQGDGFRTPVQPDVHAHVLTIMCIMKECEDQANSPVI